MSHSHNHIHEHKNELVIEPHKHHNHEVKNFGKEFIIAIVLNSVFVCIEFIYGVLTNSTALMADAGHNLSDVLGLFVAWGAFILTKRASNNKFTYGFRSSSILAAIFNAMILLLACGAIALESVQRLMNPQEVAGLTVMVVSGIGIFVNGISAWLFIKGATKDINIKGAYLHLLSDAMISLGVAISGIIIMFTNWYWLDPLSSLVIVCIIIYGTWDLLKESIYFALNAVPKNVDIEEIKKYLLSCNGVKYISDLHVWGLSTTENALTVHLIIPKYNEFINDDYLININENLKNKFNVSHTTIQIDQNIIDNDC